MKKYIYIILTGLMLAGSFYFPTLDASSGAYTMGWGSGLYLIPAIFIFLVWIIATFLLFFKSSSTTVRMLFFVIGIGLIYMYAGTLGIFSYKLQYGEFHQCWYKFNKCSTADMNKRDQMNHEKFLVWQQQCKDKNKSLINDKIKYDKAIESCSNGFSFDPNSGYIK